ncbi:PilZ domain-containing protein [Clostridium arbusti]|uniref:PilZ domain-containing protein n=1 Tax=Clostridium arbusti TaxID=1137848 RepID=UPI000289AAC7|nr:PilZ domain-containing protein [Clostridium arbusti]
MPLDSNNTYNNRRYKYEYEKRMKKRVKFELQIFYPRLNNKSINYGNDDKTPILKAVNISETGICFKSKISMKKGDFLNFLMKVGETPSFWCLSIVRWVAIDDSYFFYGLEFLSLSMNQILCIRNYIEEIE